MNKDLIKKYTAEVYDEIVGYRRHLHALDALRAVVRPELEVVAVAALVVHPGGAVPAGLALGVVGAVVPLEVLYPGQELHGGVLAEIVGQPLPIEPQTKAVFPHQRPVMIHGFQMAPEVHVRTSPN